MAKQDLWIDLSDIELEDVEVLAQDGKGVPEFAASSCSCNCGSCCGSCCIEEPSDNAR
ncbi:MAG TPA: thiopeptide-type bacteriocin [Gammaproteobacteria bacterium]|nr:thiopeptide-type bacteriocin [Gammaproteobacteria bacterium]